jgi:crotonobetainyl-CoA:carnitine CoA-transferase CaiB-like acyl-CoA transferase
MTTGQGQLVEVAMQEAVYPTLASSYEYHLRTGKVPPRTGNRQSALASAPYNAFPARDGWVSVHLVTEGHWQNLLRAMGREDLLDDPGFASNAARARNMAETEALVTTWTSGLDKAEIVAVAKRLKIPIAPVRNAVEVMNDPHMHERGMLQRIDHPSLGSIVVPNSPLRLHGADRVEPVPSPSLGQHNREIYGDWLGLHLAALERAGAI